ncbi:MAG: hypothetical protein IT195_01165 [Microthrixaceae bacterium]|nr:hypothetical protein [Microthrixaceae bacterium]
MTDRRPHAAIGARLVAAGLSVGAAFAITGAIARSGPSDPPVSPVAAAETPAPSVRVFLLPPSAEAVRPSRRIPVMDVRRAPAAARPKAVSRGS